ncbi:MAG: DUF2911 domain-containing protein [Tepidisphaeraceae bacterium]
MKKILVTAGVLIVLVFAAAIVFRFATKSYSPETNTVFEDGGLKIEVFYNRPSKKGRVIFGGLVPYGKTWRTGANEPTTFETNKALKIGDKTLPAGKYSLWTVPNEQTWTVVFNSTIPNWGIDVMNNGEAARDPQTDVLVTEVPVVNTEKQFEQFTISIAKTDDMFELVLAWDKTLVAVPLTVSE